MRSKILLPLAVLFFVLGCVPGASDRAPSGDDDTLGQGDQASAPASSTNCLICDTWEAVRLTIDGKEDPEMDPLGKVSFIIRPDSTFTIHDATEGTKKTVEGTWKLDPVDQAIILHLQVENDTLTNFEVVALHNLHKRGLVIRLLERNDEGEVLMYYQAAK